ncbi:MAG: LysR family transcriptional regulator [Chloroflexi bacterium]|nr:LysR family transcriptional regulator [Chloroflexota bacterium]
MKPQLPELEPRVNLWLEADGEVALSHWRVQLLKAIERTGSISAAAAALGVQYRLAWQRVHEMEERLGVSLLHTAAGGRGGGGSTLTPTARELILRFDNMMSAVEASAQDQYRQHLLSLTSKKHHDDIE